MLTPSSFTCRYWLWYGYNILVYCICLCWPCLPVGIGYGMVLISAIVYLLYPPWEDAWEARWARSDYLWATQGPPNSQKCTFLYIVAHIWKTGDYFFPWLYICLLCYEGLLPWKFCSPGFNVRAPQDPPNMKKSIYFFSYFGFKLKNFFSDCFLIWHVHGYGWEDSWKAR